MTIEGDAASAWSIPPSGAGCSTISPIGRGFAAHDDESNQ